jgi:hypothetical protein
MEHTQLANYSGKCAQVSMGQWGNGAMGQWGYGAKCWPSTSLDKCRKFALRTSLACVVSCHMRKEDEVGQK